MYSSAGQCILIRWSKFKSLISENKKTAEDPVTKLSTEGKIHPYPVVPKTFDFIGAVHDGKLQWPLLWERNFQHSVPNHKIVLK